MELKTKVQAAEGSQTITITRDFELPAELVYRAYTEPELLTQWMGTKVVHMECKNHGSYRFETANADGKLMFSAHGTIHEVEEGRRMVRTFEMEQAPMGVQLEFYEFEPLTDDTSRLTVNIVFKTAEMRDQQLRMPFAQGLNMAHARMVEVLSKMK